MQGLSDYELFLLERGRRGDDEALKKFMEPYLPKIFALALYLNGVNEDLAYQVTVSTFVDVLNTAFRKKDKFLILAAGETIRQSRKLAPPPLSDSGVPSNFRQAFQTLDFESRALLLLRDQLNLAHKEISRILRIPRRSVRVKIIRIRHLLKEKMGRKFRHA